jgi:hypothetical protein
MADLDGVADGCVCARFGGGVAGAVVVLAGEAGMNPWPKKLASADSRSLSCFMWVRKRLPFTAKMK